MTSGQSAFFCLTDPRCVRQEDYNEHANKSTAVNINELDKDRIGTLPAWRVMALSFVSPLARSSSATDRGSGEAAPAALMGSLSTPETSGAWLIQNGRTTSSAPSGHSCEWMCRVVMTMPSGTSIINFA